MDQPLPDSALDPRARHAGRAPGSRRRPPAAAPRGRRLEIQGLRAVAVGVVVLYHLGLDGFTGGYVGVDVFFVISGFLITSHIASQVERTGRLGLTDFWARRARRLLPASLLVLAVSLVLTRLFLPSTLWEQSLRQIFASTFYVQNWALAGDAVDYSALGNTPTVVQHYWSLSVEEQFYVLWPLLIVLAITVARRFGTPSPRAVMTGVIAALTAVSFAWSVVATEADAGHAYFDTATRIWEFGIGALLALAPLRRAPAVLGWVGLAAIAWSTATYDHTTAFPGYTALAPVVGAMLVIAASDGTPRWAPARLLSTRPAVFVGDISYAVYLWHWPLIVAWPYLTNSSTGNLDRLALVVLTLLLSWASTRWYEEPLRAGAWLRDRRRVLLASLVAMAVVAGGALAMSVQHRLEVEQARENAEAVARENAACLGPAALDPARDCDLGDSLDSVLATPDVVAAENRTVVFPGCQAGLDAAADSPCTLGEQDDPRGTVALVGDSHSTHWFSALDEWGRENGWRVRTWTRASCPFTTTQRTLPDEPPTRYDLCREGNLRILDELVRDDEISTVLTSSYSSAYGWSDEQGRDGLAALQPGVAEVARRLESAGKRFAVIRDVPSVKDKKNAPDCLARTGSVAACSLPRDEAMVPDLYARAAERLDLPVVDLTDSFCTDTTCPVVVGDVIVFRDYSHLSSAYSRLLAEPLGERLAPLLGD